MCLGNYPDVTLEEAHEKFRKAIDLVKSGVDPLRKQAEPEPIAAEPAILTVSDLKKLYIEHAKSYLVPRSVVQQAVTYDEFRASYGLHKKLYAALDRRGRCFARWSWVQERHAHVGIP